MLLLHFLRSQWLCSALFELAGPHGPLHAKRFALILQAHCATFFAMAEKDFDLSKMTRGRDLEAELAANEMHFPSVVMIELNDQACERIKAERNRFTVMCASKVQGLYLIDDVVRVNRRPTYHQSPNLPDPAVIFYTEEDGWLISQKTFQSRLPTDDNEILGMLQQSARNCPQIFDQLCIPWWKNEPEVGAKIHTRQQIEPHVAELWRLKEDSTAQNTVVTKSAAPRGSVAAASFPSSTVPQRRRAAFRSRSPRRCTRSPSRSRTPLPDHQQPDHGASVSLVPQPPLVPPESRAQCGSKVRGGWMKKCAVLVKAIWEGESWDHIKALSDSYYNSGSSEFQALCKNDAWD